MLQHPRAHADFIEFALTELRGALRIDAYNQAFAMLQRVRAAIATIPTVSADTDKTSGSSSTKRPGTTY